MASGEKLMSRIMRRSQRAVDGCVIYTGNRKRRGYRAISVDGKMKQVHRVVWEYYNGNIPDGLFVCHRCDNTSCFNIKHLFIGTHQDNMDDMSAKLRGTIGERCSSAKLTAEQVLVIREDPRPDRVLATIYGISQRQIYNIKHRRRWKWLTKENAHIAKKQ